MKIKGLPSYHFVYVILDILFAFGIVTLSFFSAYGYYIYEDHLLSSLLYAGGITLATVIVFFIFKVYKIITINIGIVECIRITICTLGVHLAGLLTVILVNAISGQHILPPINQYLFVWMLSTL